MKEEEKTEKRLSFEEYLDRYGSLTYTNRGTSMLPMLRQQRDLVNIWKKGDGRCRKYDVVLFRNKKGAYVLHRVIQVREKDYVTLGDNAIRPEVGVTDGQILGVLESFSRDGRTVLADAPGYRLYSRVWTALSPLRRFRLRAVASLRRRAAAARQKTAPAPTVSEVLDKTDGDLLYLLACFVQRQRPDPERVGRMDQARLYQRASANRLAAALGHSLGGKAAENAPWDKACAGALRSAILYGQERGALFSFLDDKGIWYLPLKGILIQDLYPAYGTREMADNDVLFDPAAGDLVRDWFLARGYGVEKFQDYAHDVYMKAPLYNFEMHRMLFPPKSGSWYDYYKNVREWLLPDGEGCRLRFTDEDFYVYFFAHASKHFQGRGGGLRSLVDLYLYGNAHPRLDWDYIQGELDKLRLKDEEARIRDLALRLFSPEAVREAPALSPEEDRFLRDLLHNGAYGRADNLVINSIRSYQKAEKGGLSPRQAKWRYVRDRLILPPEDYALAHPLVYRHKALRPLYLLWRFLRMPFVSLPRILRELRLVRRQ